MATTPSINNKINQFVIDVDLAHQIVHGGPETIVATEGGPVRSFANVVSGLDADLEAAAETVVGQVFLARDAAVNASTVAVASATTAQNAATAAQSAVDEIGDSASEAEAAKIAAAASATAAAGSATAAGSSATAAAADRLAAQAAAASIGSSVTTAQAAATSASNSATNATTASNSASTSATAAATSATNAQADRIAAQTAAGTATAAATAANASKIAAEAARDAAEEAASSVGDASGYADAAAASATAAAGSATAAAGSATTAQTARTGAETARDAAVAAAASIEDVAEEAAEASAAAAAAVAASATAQTARNDAQSAATAAAASQTAAANSATAANTAKVAAELAASSVEDITEIAEGAIAAGAAAEAAKVAAQGSATAAAGSASAAAGSATTANNAKTVAESIAASLSEAEDNAAASAAAAAASQTAAASSATAAAGSATTASGQATAASSSASAAAGSATAAANSVTTAAGHATTATTAAGTATTKATEAGASATAAAGSATAANSAKTAAEAAATSVATSVTTATNAATTATTKATEAAASATAALGSQTAAAGSATAASGSATAAATSASTATTKAAEAAASAEAAAAGAGAGVSIGLSLLNYIPQAEWAAIRNGTSTYDCTTAITNWVNALSNGQNITGIVPAGVYRHTTVHAYYHASFNPGFNLKRQGKLSLKGDGTILENYAFGEANASCGSVFYCTGGNGIIFSPASADANPFRTRDLIVQEIAFVGVHSDYLVHARGVPSANFFRCEFLGLASATGGLALTTSYFGIVDTVRFRNTAATCSSHALFTSVNGADAPGAGLLKIANVNMSGYKNGWYHGSGPWTLAVVENSQLSCRSDGYGCWVGGPTDKLVFDHCQFEANCMAWIKAGGPNYIKSLVATNCWGLDQGAVGDTAAIMLLNPNSVFISGAFQNMRKPLCYVDTLSDPFSVYRVECEFLFYESSGTMRTMFTGRAPTEIYCSTGGAVNARIFDPSLASPMIVRGHGPGGAANATNLSVGSLNLTHVAGITSPGATIYHSAWGYPAVMPIWPSEAVELFLDGGNAANLGDGYVVLVINRGASHSITVKNSLGGGTIAVVAPGQRSPIVWAADLGLWA